MKILSKGYKPYLLLFLFVLGMIITLFSFILLIASKDEVSYFLLLSSTIFGFLLTTYSIFNGMNYYKEINGFR